MNIVLSVQEVEIIEKSLHGDMNFFDRRDLLIRLGRVLGHGRTVRLSLSKEELWFLRDNIQWDIEVGEYTGFELIRKIYGVLIGETDIIPESYYRDNRGHELIARDENEDTTQEKDRAVCRPQAEA
jgi:hypothetical protein